MSSPKVRDFASEMAEGTKNPEGRKRKREVNCEDNRPEPGPVVKKHQFSTFQEKGPDEELLQTIQSLLGSLEQKRDDASKQGDTRTPYHSLARGLFGQARIYLVHSQKERDPAGKRHGILT
ncbi:hypothetical protein ACJ72_02951 [Emergomyces africanus]|uniref:Uncharacterized protein n=1 Tax=Emergomyces africanus TaxID=1955775 RepID=A0A1B7P104_9EURO|nr:hypothetical protein ACJ72_02951 [Emergomyces africanus]